MPNDTPNGNDQPDLNRRVTVLEQARKEMEDALLVHAHLEAAAARRLKEHAEYLADHEKRMQQAERQDEIQREKNRELDQRIASLVSAIGEFIRRYPAPPPA